MWHEQAMEWAICPINLVAWTYPCPTSAARITRLLHRHSLLVNCVSGSSAVGGEEVADSKAPVGPFCKVSIEELTAYFIALTQDRVEVCVSLV
jgi:hypothetical protein